MPCIMSKLKINRGFILGVQLIGDELQILSFWLILILKIIHFYWSIICTMVLFCLCFMYELVFMQFTACIHGICLDSLIRRTCYFIVALINTPLLYGCSIIFFLFWFPTIKYLILQKNILDWHVFQDSSNYRKCSKRSQ